ncbi:MAG: hypothetical protein RIT28_909 [Pseudomonadota bacterium]
MSRTVLVLTATGATGQEVVSSLVARGATVRAATRDPSRQSVPGATAVAFDIADPTTWGPALASVDAVYFCLPPFREDEVSAGTAFLHAAKDAGVKRIVKLSAAGVEANPESGHRQLELVIEGLGVEWVHLRPSFFFENLINFYGGGIKGARVIALPAGQGRTGFIATADIGEAAAVALLGDVSGEAWTLTGPESLTHDEVAGILSDALGEPVRFHDIAPEEHIGMMRSWGMNELAVATMSGLYGFVRAGWTGGLTDDVQRVTGRAPQRLADWAQKNAAAWR